MDDIDDSALFHAITIPSYAGDELNAILIELINRIAAKSETKEESAAINEIDGHSDDIDAYNSIFLRLQLHEKLDSITIDLLVSLLSNCVIHSNQAEALFMRYLSNDATESPSLGKKMFYLILNRFLDYYPQAEDKTDREDWAIVDPWQHVGSILTSIVHDETGRKILMNPEESYFKKLVVQVRSRNPVRRRGTIATVRSCLFDHSTHEYILKVANIVPHLMFHLIVPKPFTDEVRMLLAVSQAAFMLKLYYKQEKVGMDPILWMQANNSSKTCERDSDILKMMVECLLLFCQSRPSRDELRKRKVYPMIRNLDETIESEEISGIIYEIVNFLVRDEDEDNSHH